MTFRVSLNAVRLFALVLLLAPAASAAQVYTVGALTVPGVSAEEAAGSSLVRADLDGDTDHDLVVGGKTPTGSGILRAYRRTGAR
jgi:hypothetical protein